MRKPKVLYIVHNHPSVRPGGAEGYALELYEAMRDGGDFEPILLAKGGPPFSTMKQPHPGTLFGSVNDDPNQYFFFADPAGYDWFYGTSTDKDIYTKFYRAFLEAHRPDVVHFQHTAHLGFDLIRETKNTLPQAAMLYTLHEYLPICYRQGQMVRVGSEERCLEASPRRCHECFPERAPQDFFMRKKFIQAHFELIDLFLAPSHFLLERYLDWGIPESKIQFEDYGRLPARRIPEEPTDRPRNRLGFFGQLSAFKGVDVLLQAMKILLERKDGAEATFSRGPFAPAVHVPGSMPHSRDADPHLWLHGANLELQQGSYQTKVRELLEATRDRVTFVGRYGREEVPKLMSNIDWVVIPSVWWENAPLVIQEAFQHGKPVICSNIGGMAEKVTDGVNGLHFRVADPVDLAETIRRAVSTPGLWETLQAGVPSIYRIEDSIQKLSGIYRSLMQRNVEAYS